MRGALVGLCIFGCTAVGCDDPEAHRAQERQDAEQAQIARLADPIHGLSEAESLVRRYVSLQDQVIVIQSVSAIYDAQAFTTPAPWVVTCGAGGISVTFRVGTDDGEIGPRTILSWARPSREECVTISRSIARALKGMLGGQ